MCVKINNFTLSPRSPVIFLLLEDVALGVVGVVAVLGALLDALGSGESGTCASLDQYGVCT